MNETFTIHPILGCLSQVEIFLGTDNTWEPISEIQEKFLAFCDEKARKDLICLEDEMKDIASKDVDAVNAWLAEQGFPDLQLDKVPNDSQAFYVASILKVVLEWINKGRKIKILSHNTDQYYPGVRLTREDYQGALNFYTLRDHANPIACIQTKNKSEYVCMTIMDEELSDIEKMEFVLGFMKEHKEFALKTESKSALMFPMIDYDEQVDISYLQGMKVFNGREDYFIAQAIQQTRFQMDEVGAIVESAAAMSSPAGCSFMEDPEMLINKPFLLWVFRRGMALPYFIGYFSEKHWKEPNIQR
jgi:hypothetical protein